MAYKTKLPVRKEKDLFDLDKDETLTGESFEMNKEYMELPKDNMESYKDDHKFETQEEKEADIYSLPKNENDGDDTLFRTSDTEIIEDVNQELESMGKPLKVINRDTLEVSANGKWHKVTRKNLYDYQKQFANETGDVGNEVTRYREFSGIHGDFEALDRIALDVKNTFAMIDDSKGSYETLESEY